MTAINNALRRVLGFRSAPPPVILSIYRSSLQKRVFGTTSIIEKVTGPVPKFEPTSDPKLDALLAELRDDHFIPAYLPRVYFRYVYRSKRHLRLIDDPITIDIGGEPYTLKPKTAQPGAPVKKLIEALGLMKEPSDFENLPEMLRGYHKINHALGQVMLKHITTKLVERGNTDALMSIARTAEKTGFRFNRSLAQAFMFALRNKQQHSKRISGDVPKLLRNANELLTILGKRELYFEPGSAKRYSDDPSIVGAVLSMYADTSLRYHEQWHRKATQELVVQLRSVWDNIQWDHDLQDYDGTTPKTPAKKTLDNCITLKKGYTIVLEAMLQAKKALADPETMGLEPMGSEETGSKLAGPGPVEPALEDPELANPELASSEPAEPKPPRQRPPPEPVDPELPPWLEAESERLATLITKLDEFVVRNKPLLPRFSLVDKDKEQGVSGKKPGPEKETGNAVEKPVEKEVENTAEKPTESEKVKL